MKDYWFKSIPYGYGLPVIREDEGSILIRVNKEEFEKITPSINYRFDFALLVSTYYLLIIFETEFTTETRMNCISNSFFDVEAPNDSKVLELIIKQGYISYWFCCDIFERGKNYKIPLADSMKELLADMIRLARNGIEAIPKERRDPIKAVKSLLNKRASKLNFKEFLRDPEMLWEKYREFLRRNN
jgi:hypothetical protein